ncbi:AP2-associated protein kinase 1-like isoform X2 [Bolinopsis microptera]|uniref:AP2-associated protein kinase 1-like isoform X2 n=1 Tax=Bolinopsis microptera TaxID=2820187 RepID=UPI00307A25CE
MKKLFASSKQDSQYDSFVGKHYGVGDLTLVVEDVIAEGGFSFVFLVRDTTKNRIFALKRMLVNSQVDLENCKQEILIMKSFHRHPAMVSFKGHHTKHIGNGIYEVLLLMQHCPNGTVVDLMNQHLSSGFTETLIRQIFTGIVDAVALLHENGYSHRDLKVENILIGPSKEYVLCDFGSAHQGDLDPEAHGHNFVEENILKFTTLAYRAPEMCDMYLGYKIGPAADLWALGVLLYKLCFFTTPFEENTLAIARAKFAIPDPDKYSDNLISIIRDTLKVNPSDRLNARQIISRLKNDEVKSKEQVPASLKEVVQPAPSIKRVQPALVTQDHTNKHVEPATPNEDSSTVKSRSRPRAINKPSEVLLIAPPETALSRDHAAPSRDITMTSRDSVMTSRDTNDLEVRVKRHSLHSSPQLTKGEDPWGSTSSANASPHQRPPPATPATPLSTTSPLVFLPPPPASPSHKVVSRRGHSRAKSDTTFLKNISNPMSNPFLWEEEKRSYEMSSSAGQLSSGAGPLRSVAPTPARLPRSAATSREEGVNNPVYRSGLSYGSETNFEESGWSNNPFEPAPGEDEFLKLSLRDKGSSQTRLDQIPTDQTNNKAGKSSKVARAKTPRADPALLSSEQLSLPRPRAFSNEAMMPLNRTLSDPEPTASSPNLHHGKSLNSLDSRSTSATKKKRKINFFGKKKVLSQEDFVAKHSGTYRSAVLGNPLYDDLNT